MNKRGQMQWFGGLIVLFFFVLFWIFGLSPWLTTIGQDAVTTTNATGIEALFWSNLNLLIFFVVVLAMFVIYKYYQGVE
jgi:TRAP-type C4-dicarboxylate transport system permease small subunit